MVVGLGEHQALHVKLGNVGGECSAEIGIISLQRLSGAGGCHQVKFHRIGVEIVTDILRAGGASLHADLGPVEFERRLHRQRAAMFPRLYPKIPGSRYLCFYPMDRRRGEDKNWYTLPIEERQRQMEEHGMVGRRYAGKVQQIITGSIGFDDWEWGVDLFAEDPLVFKKLIYEMRFDEVSAVYALFGQFYVGVRVPASHLEKLLNGELPK